MLTNQLLPIGNLGVLQSGANAAGAVLFVCSVNGLNNRGRVKFPGASAATTQGSQQGPQVDPAFPLASVAYALTLTKSGRGDIIVCLPGHVETLSTANANLINITQNAVVIYGLGTGNERPYFTIVTAASLTISATGISINNCIFDASAASNLAEDFLISGAQVEFFNCKLLTHTGTGAGISLAAGWSGFRWDTSSILNGVDTTATAVGEAITAVAGDGLRITNSTIRGVFTTAALVSTGKVTNWHVDTSELRQNNTAVAALISLGETTDTGLFANNQFYSYDAATAAQFIAGTGAAAPDVTWLQNFGYIHKTGGPFSGILVPAVGTIP